ncbi:MAG: hypothetical protein JJU13_02615 [Balneolaceae bacterium]|nr:hypothetical protein [Balneolaceae bacterium]
MEKVSVIPPMTALSGLAIKYSRRPDEAYDLVQELLLETVRIRRKPSDESFMLWAHGFNKKLFPVPFYTIMMNLHDDFLVYGTCSQKLMNI